MRVIKGRISSGLIAVILFVASCFSLVSPAFAQTPARLSVTLSPTTSSFTADAGSTVNGQMTVVNDGTAAYDLLLYAKPYSVNNNQYSNPDFTTVTKTGDLNTWIRFPQTNFNIAAGATQMINYSVQIPKGAAPGGHYGVIFAEIQPPKEAISGNSVVHKERAGMLMYATVNGAVNLSGSALKGSIPFWQFQPPLNTTVTARNTGNTDFVDTVNLTVRDVFGNVKYQISKDYHVLPSTDRTISIGWAESPWLGLYNVQTQQKFLNKSIDSQGYVLMMPRYIPVVIIVLIVVGGAYKVIRRRNK